MGSKRPKKSIPAVGQTKVIDRQLRFSFKHLDFENPKFHPQGCSADYFYHLFEILRRFSTWRVGEFIDQNNEDHRHVIVFADTTEPDGFQEIPGLDREQFGSRGRMAVWSAPGAETEPISCSWSSY